MSADWQKLGATFRTENGNIIGEVGGKNGRLKGCRMYLGGAQGPTVLGTINVMCAAALAEGETVLVGAACEPEGQRLCRHAQQDGRED